MSIGSPGGWPPKYQYQPALTLVWRLMTALGFAGAGLAVVYLWQPIGWGGQRYPWLESAILIGWSIGPPAWFALEYMCLITDEEKMNDDLMKRYKQELELARNFWVGVGALIVALYLKNLPDKVAADRPAAGNAPVAEKLSQSTNAGPVSLQLASIPCKRP
jgi:hypothetical protein